MTTTTTTKTLKIPKFDGMPTGYTHVVGASALLFSGENKALRVEVPELGKEFADTQFIGTDPEGVLYYDDDRNLDVGLTAYYKVYKFADNTGNFINIKFYHNEFKPGQPDPACHAEFWANDPNNTVSATGMDGYTYYGNWKVLDISSATTEFKKYVDMDWISVSAESVSEKATIALPQGLLDKMTFVVRGNLFFRQDTTISEGIKANYNNDRVVFYHDDYTAKDFTAYFIPFEIPQDNLGIPADQTKILDATWN
ncbi:hypothetical protein C8R44DRAFT_987537 [Mycena epipterygia]|nr:hypothetical protein C8R44DRAFT_987537 [Mycena epipterygia]